MLMDLIPVALLFCVLVGAGVKLASKSLAVSVLALASCLLLPSLLVVAFASGAVLRARLLGLLGLAAFSASLPLACISWWMASRALAVHPTGAETGGLREALRARSYGRSTVLLWALLVLFAALTYTKAAR